MENIDLISGYSEDYKTKNEVLKAVEDCVDGILPNSSKEIRRDKSIILKVFSWSGDDYKYISSNLKNDEELAFEALKTASFSSYVLEFIGDALKENSEFFIKALKWLEDNRDYDGEIKYCSENLKNNVDFAKKVLKIFPESIVDFDESIQKSKEVLLSLAKNSGSLKGVKLDEGAINDKKFVIKLIKEGDKGVYNTLSDSLKNDDEICFAFLKNNLDGMSSIPLEKKADENFMMKLIKEDLNAITYCADNLKTSSFYLNVIREKARAFEYLPLKFRMDKNFVLQAYKENKDIYEFLLEKFKDDEDFKK